MAWLRTQSKTVLDPSRPGVKCESYPILIDTRCLFYAIGVPAEFGPGCVLYLSGGQSLCVEMGVDEVLAFIELEEKGF